MKKLVILGLLFSLAGFAKDYDVKCSTYKIKLDEIKTDKQELSGYDKKDKTQKATYKTLKKEISNKEKFVKNIKSSIKNRLKHLSKVSKAFNKIKVEDVIAGCDDPAKADYQMSDLLVLKIKSDSDNSISACEEKLAALQAQISGNVDDVIGVNVIRGILDGEYVAPVNNGGVDK